MVRYYQQCQECGGHAFEYKKKPQPGQPMFAEDIVGEPYQPGDEKTCQECHLPISQADLSFKNVIIINEKNMKDKNKTIAIVLALFFGGFGIHKFYLGKIGLGIAYALFVWTMIPALLGLIDLLVLALMSDEKFNLKYN